MQRAIYALVALLTLCASALLPVRAQDIGDKSTEPTQAPQPIDKHADHATASADRDSSDKVKSSSTLVAGFDDTVAVRTDDANTTVILPDQTLDNLVVRDRKLILEGHVRHDVLAINSDVIVKPGATVGHVVDVVGGAVNNEAGNDVHIVRQDAGVVALLDDTIAIPAPAPPAVQTIIHDAPLRPKESWPGAQLALLLLGLLTSLVIVLVSPRAARQTSDVVGSDRGRSLAFGLIGTTVMIPGLLLGALILRSPLGLLLSPFVVAFALVCAVLLAYGWVCGVAEVGFLLQRRMRVRQGSWFAQTVFGLGGFFLVNLIAGSIWRGLGICGLMLEGLVALMGLGAILISGFGADANWLSARLRGEIGWTARSPRL